MGIELTKEQVLALAPDDASAKAGAGLAFDAKWGLLGADDDAAWGECKGSGAKPYQTQVDLAGLACRCSCPSRKFPCKHGLALLLLFAQKHPRFANAERPPWVGEWLASRREKAAKKEQAATVAAPADPEAAAQATAKREAARWKRIESGTADLQRWIADQFRNGLGRFGAAQAKEGKAMAARMVDAQAPGLGQRLEEALDAMGVGAARHEEAIERLGLLQLINEGVSRRERLAPARLADLRSAIGWPHEKETVAATGEKLADEWLVLGQRIETADERLFERRIWLHGRQSGRHALLLDFAFGGKAWEGHWEDGVAYAARLAFYPGTLPLRALATGPATRSTERRGWPSLDAHACVDRVSEAFAANPWLPLAPMLLRNATPVVASERWLLHTEAGAIPLRHDAASAWSLLAFSGGRPLHVMGEWDGRRLRPLSACDPVDEAQRWSTPRHGAGA